jgi:hypothetical protein
MFVCGAAFPLVMLYCGGVRGRESVVYRGVVRSRWAAGRDVNHYYPVVCGVTLHCCSSYYVVRLV